MPVALMLLTKISFVRAWGPAAISCAHAKMSQPASFLKTAPHLDNLHSQGVLSLKWRCLSKVTDRMLFKDAFSSRQICKPFCVGRTLDLRRRS